MSFRLRPLVAVMALAATAGAASAQSSGDPFATSGTGNDPLLLAPPSGADDGTAGTSTTATTQADDGDTTGRVQRVRPVAPGPEPDPLDETATGSIARRGSIDPEADPFAPVGIRAGSFILLPSITTTVEHQTNGSGNGKSTDLTVTPELRLQSDWARHEATLTLRGAYDQPLDDQGKGSPSGSIIGTARIDIKPDWDIAFEGTYDYSQQEISDPDYPSGATGRPSVHDLNGSTTLSGRFGRKVFELEGNVAHTEYENGQGTSGTIDQGFRDNSVFGARLRVGYETPLGVTPFVEGEGARRIYDRVLDDNGIRRSSYTAIARAGIELDRGPVLTGEMAVGYGVNRLDDSGFDTIGALTLDGSLVWSPVRLVTITTNASTTFDPTTDAASAGSVTHNASVDFAYQWKQNLTLNWTGGLTRQAYQGTGQIDTTITAGFGATWKLSRWAWLTGGYVHEWADSTDAANRYQSDSLKVELRVQK